MTQLTGHTRFYFISQCIRLPYFVFFVLFSSACLHLILTAGRHLEHFRFKMRVSILDLSLKCKTPATTNIAWVSTHALKHTHRHVHAHTVYTHTHIYTGRWGSFAMQKSSMDPFAFMAGRISTSNSNIKCSSAIHYSCKYWSVKDLCGQKSISNRIANPIHQQTFIFCVIYGWSEYNRLYSHMSYTS